MCWIVKGTREWMFRCILIEQFICSKSRFISIFGFYLHIKTRNYMQKTLLRYAVRIAMMLSMKRLFLAMS